jgi:3',5'-cyclic AMP phosphodiesterase CpdA
MFIRVQTNQMQINETATIRLLLIGDTHVCGAGAERIHRARFDAAVNRALGALGAPERLRLRTPFKTGAEILSQLEELLKRDADRVDHILVAGDVTDTGTERDYELARGLFLGLGRGRVSPVPGNHDIRPNYNPLRGRTLSRRFTRHFGPLMGDGAAARARPFPYVKTIAPGFTVIGLDTTDGASRIEFYGRLGGRQLADLERILAAPEHAADHKIILMHHDVTVETPLHYDYMRGRNAFLDLLRRHTARARRRDITIVCGHTHRLKILPGYIPGVSLVCVPMFAMNTSPDHIIVTLDAAGGLHEAGPSN